MANEDEDDDQVFTVEMIVDHRGQGTGCQYLVHWSGYSAAHDSVRQLHNPLPLCL